MAQARKIAFMNQKGGVGKTTTAVNLGAALALAGRRVLMIDLDPQAHLTLHMGLDPDRLERTTYDLLIDPDVTAASVLHKITDKISVLPAQVNMAGAETELAPLAAAGTAQRVLTDKCAALGPYDYTIMDCPPSLGLLTLNALVLAREVMVPMQAHFLALQGLSKLLETVSLVRQSLNPTLEVAGIVLCMHEGHTLLAHEIVNDLKSFFEAARTMDVPWRNARLLDPPIRRNIKLAECPSHGKTIFQYEPKCSGAADYKALAQAVLALEVA